MNKNTVISRSHTSGLMIGLMLALSLVAVMPMIVHAADPNPAQEGAIMDAVKNPNIGNKFPTVNAQTLAGQEATIPDDAAGKVVLVCVAFARESQAQLDSWLNPFYEKFGSREDIMFYEVPMISGGYKFMKLIIDGGMRGGLPEFKHKHVVTMYGDVDIYLQGLSLDKDSGYAFLLDREGSIRWQEQGFSTEETLGSLFIATEDLLKK